MNPLDGVRISDAWLTDTNLQALFDVLCDDQGEALVVGGAVRNSLMNKPVTDIDVATTLLPDEVINRMKTAGHKALPTGIDHGTVTVVIDAVPFEVTTLRQDIDTDGRHATVQFGLDWDADAQRRDFTVNGLYCDREGQVFDPVNGYTDLQAGTVRFIGDAETRIREDALRILRFFRFFAWYGNGRPDAGGLKACTANKSLLSGLSRERVWAELKKLLSAPDPSRALLWMRTTGVLTAVLPETEKWGIDAIPGLLLLEGQEKWEADPLLRLMAMVRPDETAVKNLADRLSLSNLESDRLKNWAGADLPHPDIDEIDFSRFMYQRDKQASVDAMRLDAVHLANREKDVESKAVVALVAQANSWERPVFPVKGQDLLDLGVSPGKEVGSILGELENAWMEGGFEKSKQDLLDLFLSRRS